MKKRILSLLLTLVMILGMLPATTLTANAAGLALADFYTTIRVGDDVYDVATTPSVSGDGYTITSTGPVNLVIQLTNYNGGPIYIESSNALVNGQIVMPKIEVLGECVINVPSGYEGYGIEYYSMHTIPDFTIEFDDLFTDLYGDASLTIQGGGAGAIQLGGKDDGHGTQSLELIGPVGSKLIINMTEGDGIITRNNVDDEYTGRLNLLESDVGVKVKVPDGHYTFRSRNMRRQENYFTNFAEILSVTVNGTSVADGATYTTSDKQLAVKTTYDNRQNYEATSDFLSVRHYSQWYLNGEKLIIAAVTPVDNGNGTSSDTYYRTLNDGDELEIETWLEVKWPDGTTDIVDEHTVTIIAKTPKFTTQPQGGTVVYNQRHIANWATNFTPVKQELVRYTPTGNVLQVLEISAGAVQASLSYMADGYYYRIRSYYDYYSNAYVESDKFYVTTDPYFTPNYEHGNAEGDIIAGITYVPNGDGTFNANVHVDLSYVDGQMLQQAWGGTGYYWYDHNNKLHNASVDVGTSKIYFTLYDVGENLVPGKEWRVKVYLADDYYADWEWRNVTFHYVTDTVPELKPEDVVTPAFTTQPKGGEVAKGEKLTVSWATNFTPVKTVLMKVIIHPVDGEVVTRENLGTATSAAVGAGYEYCIVRAYYSDSNYVDSDKFYVTEKVSDTGVTVNCIGDIDYTVSGNVVTVDHEVACKVGYLDGTAYKAIAAVANGNGTYSFTAPAGVTEVLLVVKGDVSGDGRVNMGDVSKLYAHIKGTNMLTGVTLFVADISDDGRINMGDVSKLYAHIKGTNLLTWDT